jgi:glycosyltransferase involved in cell wall biosynthesis
MKISLIIPAYNEEKLIPALLQSLVSFDMKEDEIICVNDGSTDKTLQEINKFKDHIKIVNIKKNKGKGYALAEGVKCAKNNLVVFIDADITGLQKKHIQTLARQLTKNKYNAAIGYLTKNKMDFFLRPLMGERAYWRKDLLPHLREMRKKGYGIELFLNRIFMNKKVKLCALKGTGNTMKQDKQPLDTAVRLFLVEILEASSEFIKNPESFSAFFHYTFFPKLKKNQIKHFSSFLQRKIINKLLS